MPAATESERGEREKGKRESEAFATYRLSDAQRTSSLIRWQTWLIVATISIAVANLHNAPPSDSPAIWPEFVSI